MILDTCSTEHAQLKPFLDAVVSVVSEQLTRVDQFNLISCSDGMECWREGLTRSSDESVAEAVQWVEQVKPQTTPFKTNIVEGLLKALAHSDAEAIFLLVHGDCTLRAFNMILEEVKGPLQYLIITFGGLLLLQVSPSLIPVHIVVYNCKAPQTLQKYQQLASASSARQVWRIIPSTGCAFR